MHIPKEEYYDYQEDEFEPKTKGNNIFKILAIIFIFTISLAAVFGIGYGLGIKGNPQIAGSLIKNGSDITLLSAEVENNTETKKSAIDVIKQVSNSVVSITSNVIKKTKEGSHPTINAGSGIIINEDDKKIYIVTNDHVISDATSLTISLDDSIQVEAEVIGRESLSDLAVISVLKSNLDSKGVKNYLIADFADTTNLKVGEEVIAIGNAAGEGKSATKGIISALNKTIQVDGKSLSVIQTDAAINPGNSGGALVDLDGQVIAVNTAKYSNAGRESGDKVEGMGYAIPANEVLKIIKPIIEVKSKNPNTSQVAGGTKASLGVRTKIISEDQYNILGMPVGLYITDVYAASNAEIAGLRAGDIIVSYNDIQIETMDDLVEVLDNTRVGQSAEIGIYRNGQLKNITVNFSVAS